jgi:HD-GYP domain-containing protein (c-di-GMP phosphodiesterase class II)
LVDLERVPLADVRDLIVVGRPFPFAVLDAEGRLLLGPDQVVGSERQFEQLVERGAWVERPKVEEVRRQRFGAAAVDRSGSQLPCTVIDQWEQLTSELESQNRALGRGAGRAEVIQTLVSELVALVRRDGDFAIFLCIRPDLTRPLAYAVTHPVHCAVACALAAQSLGWTTARVHSLAGAAMTMNASFIDLQNQLAQERDPPTKKQMEKIRDHPHASAELLRQAGIVDADWLQAVEDHHERSGGQGYPRGLGEVGDGATLLRLVDVYMAKVSARRARVALSPQVSAQQLFQQHGKLEREGPLAIAVIRTLGGAYPPGALVQLKSGEVGVVARRPQTGAAPLVATLSDAHGEPIVNTRFLDSANPTFAIAGALLDPSRFQRILPERVYGILA